MPEWFETMADPLWLLSDEQGQEEAQFIAQALHLRKGQAVLDAPSGAGRIAIHVAQRGCRVTLLDLRATFLRRARQRFRREGQVGRFIRGDLRELDFEGEFDAIYNWLGSFGYFPDRENAELVVHFARALRKGGRLLIAQPNREFILRHFMRRIPAYNCISHNSWDAKRKRVISRRYVDGVYDPKNISSMRLYAPGEMMRLYRSAGLRLETIYGSLEGDVYCKASRQMYVVGRKQ